MIYDVLIFECFLPFEVRCYHKKGRIVIHYQFCIDLLEKKVPFTGMEANHISSIFKVSKSGFLTPYADILEMPINLW